MEMHQIRYFLAVCETLNFTRAAEVCNVTQPALTRAIQKLEEELGGLLLRRERNLSHLTDFGRLLYPQLKKVHDDTEAAKSTARQFLKLEDAALNVGVMCTVGPVHFMSFLSQFRMANPGVELTLTEGVPQRLSELLLEGKLDLAVMAQPQAFDGRLEVVVLYEERFMVAFPSGHRFEEKNGLKFADMDGESYLLRINCEYREELRDRVRAEGAVMKRSYRSEREDWIQTMVAAGFGICFIPEYTPSIPGVLTRPLVDPEVRREISLAYIAGRRFSPAVATFVQALKRYQWNQVAVTG
jgi:LysR family hydrogen peroxide-inducible transcriptional activator